MNRKRRGILLIVLGAVMVLAGLGLHAIHERQDALAGQNAAVLLSQLSQEIKFNDSFIGFSPEPEASDRPAESEPPGAPEQPGSEELEPMASRTLSGYDLVGILRVPSVGVELPVLGSWNYSLLNVAPCRYSGNLESGDLILLGHNYKSHLQPLEWVNIGDAVEFTGVDGTAHLFRVAEKENIHESDPELLQSEHPLIIFTCTRDGLYRIVVRCEKAD